LAPKTKNTKYFILCLVLIFLEIGIAVASKFGLINLNYGWASRLNRYVLFSVICAQILFLFLIVQIRDAEKQRTLFLGQIVLFFCMALWIVLEMVGNYKKWG